MRLLKGFLLGSAAAIAAVTGASAADLPMTKSAPVEYVRVCSEHGKGFFYLPGSDTCLKIGGRVRADTQYQQTFDRGGDSFNFGVQSRLQFDVRSNTPYGTVRAYMRYTFKHGDANWSSKYATADTGVKGDAAIDLAYIQFAGLTAGRAQSFFDFYANEYNFGALRDSDVKTQLLAYTATFSKDISLTLSLEDGNERRLYKGSIYSAAGQSAPDAVGALMIKQGWGSAKLAAAVHQIRTAYDPKGKILDKDAIYGWAVKGGVKLDLPMIAPGDELWVEGAYSQGALSYIGGDYKFHPNTAIAIVDVYGNADSSIRKKTRGWSAMVDFLHYWTSSIRQNVFASYMKVDYDRFAYNTKYLQGVAYNNGLVPTSEWRVGTNLIWSPIKNFDIGAEVLYSRTTPKGRVLSANNGLKRLTSFEDQWQGRLRLERNF